MSEHEPEEQSDDSEDQSGVSPLPASSSSSAGIASASAHPRERRRGQGQGHRQGDYGGRPAPHGTIRGAFGLSLTSVASAGMRDRRIAPICSNPRMRS